MSELKNDDLVWMEPVYGIYSTSQLDELKPGRYFTNNGEVYEVNSGGYGRADNIYNDPDIELQLYVCGTHLSKVFGETISEIKYPIVDKIPKVFRSSFFLVTVED